MGMAVVRWGGRSRNLEVDVVLAGGLFVPRTAAFSGAADDRQLVVAVVVAIMLLALSRAVARWRGPRPAPGEVWFAEVPFADGSGSKDRPVLVLAVEGRACTVARFTSRDQDGRRDYRRLPASLPGLHGTSWADLRPVTLRRRALRRRVARADAALLLWYGRESGSSAAA